MADSRPDAAAPRPTVLTYNGGNIDINTQTRAVAIPCVHPDGLLEAYVCLVPIHQLKKTLSVLLQHEGSIEEQRLATMRQQQGRIIGPSGRPT